jgi:hypothetical protein
MSFFGIHIQITLQHTDAKIYYSYPAATRKEDVENMGNMDILIPTYGTG